MGRNNRMFALGIAELVEVRKGHSENLSDKRMYCDLILDSGVPRKNVPFYGPTVDLITKKLHGVHFPPRPNQMVAYMFVAGHNDNPVVCFSLPFDWGQSKNLNTFVNTISSEMSDKLEDCALYHYSGSKIIMNKDGSIEIEPLAGKDIIINSGTKGSARLDDQVKSTNVEDATYWSWLSGLITVFTTWVPVPNDGGAALSTAINAYIGFNPVPTSLTGKITAASSKVKVGD